MESAFIIPSLRGDDNHQAAKNDSHNHCRALRAGSRA